MPKRLKVLLIINVLALLLIKMLTIEHAAISGNGNLGLFGIVIFVPFALWLTVEWVKWGSDAFDTLSRRRTALAASVLILIGGTWLSMERFQNFKPNFIAELKQSPHTASMLDHPDYVNIMTDGLTIFTNTLYFNFTTFLMYLAICTLFALPRQQT